jgi:hypothetical protein
LLLKTIFSLSGDQLGLPSDALLFVSLACSGGGGVTGPFPSVVALLMMSNTCLKSATMLVLRPWGIFSRFSIVDIA